LQPSVIWFIPFIVIGIIIGFLFIKHQRLTIPAENTQKEISEMSERLEKWNEKFGQYPTELNELIGKSPLRQSWRNDTWNRPYKYAITENGKAILITSAGSDGQFGTEDDIQSK
jgi:hypothetical protein